MTGVMERGHKPQDKGRYLHPAQTASWQSEIKEFDYVYTSQFRICPPYKFEFGTCIKARWVGRPLIEIFSQEFPYFDDSNAYYQEAMREGRLRVNDQQTANGYLCRDGDIVTHHVHRHEPPVANLPVTILFEGEDLVVVNKPSSIPIHPGGRYRRNTLIAILAKEHSLFDLHPVHRLDRLTSGVLLLARNATAAEKKRKEFTTSNIKKQYLARVVGKIPTQTITVDQPIRCKSHREAIHEVHAEGKPSQTRVTVLASRGEEALVLCEPLTGRTHQIRLHLQHLECPIANDPLYGPLGVGSTSTPQVAGQAQEDEDEQGLTEESQGDKKRTMAGGAWGARSKRHKSNDIQSGALQETFAREDEKLGLRKNGWFDPSCVHCRASDEEGCKGYYVPLKRNHEDSENMLIWLHALTITGDSWSFSSSLPAWALEFEAQETLAAKIPGYKIPIVKVSQDAMDAPA